MYSSNNSFGPWPVILWMMHILWFKKEQLRTKLNSDYNHIHKYIFFSQIIGFSKWHVKTHSSFLDDLVIVDKSRGKIVILRGVLWENVGHSLPPGLHKTIVSVSKLFWHIPPKIWSKDFPTVLIGLLVPVDLRSYKLIKLSGITSPAWWPDSPGVPGFPPHASLTSLQVQLCSVPSAAVAWIQTQIRVKLCQSIATMLNQCPGEWRFKSACEDVCFFVTAHLLRPRL